MSSQTEYLQVLLLNTIWISVQDAIDWLDKNQDKTLDDIKNAEGKNEGEDGDEEAPALQAGEEARSLVCNECGKKFRGTSQAEWHATKTLVLYETIH